MSEILDSFQERRRRLPDGALSNPPEMAVVKGRDEGGIELLVDGADNSDTRRYPYNLAADKIMPFAPGMRVLVRKVGEVYVVICPIGPTKATLSE